MVLAYDLADPVNLDIVADHIVSDIGHEHLVILVGGLLRKPVGILNPDSSQPVTDTFLSNRLQTSVRLQLVNTVGFFVSRSYNPCRMGVCDYHTDHSGCLLLHTDWEDGESLLSFVTEMAGLVRSGRPRGMVKLR